MIFILLMSLNQLKKLCSVKQEHDDYEVRGVGSGYGLFCESYLDICLN